MIVLLSLAGLTAVDAVFPATVRGVTVHQSQLLRLHNDERVKRNRPRLRLHGALNLAATRYAQLMDAKNHFSHIGPAPQYSTPLTRIRAAGGSAFSRVAENIAYGFPTPAAVTRAWMGSAGHRRNILDGSLRYVGFGRAGTEPFWVANFGG